MSQVKIADIQDDKEVNFKAYLHLKKNNKYYFSTEGLKVDIYFMDFEDFVSEKVERGKTWEEIKQNLVFNFGNYDPIKSQEKIDKIYKTGKEYYDDMFEIVAVFYDRSQIEMIENAKKGWSWFQNKKCETDKLFTYQGWLIFDETKKKEFGSTAYMTESVLKSGLWEKGQSILMRLHIIEESTSAR